MFYTKYFLVLYHLCLMCKHFLLLLMSVCVCVCVCLFIYFFNPVFCFIFEFGWQMGANWCFFDGQHSICPDPHQTPSCPAMTLLLLFSLLLSSLFSLAALSMFLSFWLLPHPFFLPSPSHSSSQPTETVTCFLFTLISLHLQLFSLLPLSSVCTLICNLIVVAGVIQFGCRVTGNVEDFILHALTDVTLFIARLTGFSHISIAYLWGGGKWWRWFRGILWSVKFPVWRTLRWPQNDLWLFIAFLNISLD